MAERRAPAAWTHRLLLGHTDCCWDTQTAAGLTGSSIHTQGSGRKKPTTGMWPFLQREMQERKENATKVGLSRAGSTAAERRTDERMQRTRVQEGSREQCRAPPAHGPSRHRCRLVLTALFFSVFSSRGLNLCVAAGRFVVLETAVITAHVFGITNSFFRQDLKKAAESSL